MKFFSFMVVAALSFSVVACDPAKAPVVGNAGNMAAIHNADNSVEFVPQPEVTESAVTDKMMFAAETLYNVPAHAYVAADSRKQLSAETKAKVKPILTQLYSALKAARTAYALNNAVDFRKAFDTLTNLSAKANDLLPKSK